MVRLLLSRAGPRALQSDSQPLRPVRVHSQRPRRAAMDDYRSRRSIV